jgi:hypothetical protein
VQAKPTTRINILIARCMGCFSLRAGSLGAETPTAENYTPVCNFSGAATSENRFTNSVKWICKSPGWLAFILVIQWDRGMDPLRELVPK